MCGRVTLYHKPDEIAKRFKATSVALDEFKPSYNVPPSAKVPIVVTAGSHRRLETAVWGLKREVSSHIINLRAERLIYGSFKELVAKSRCIVPVDGFYEWATKEDKKYPMHFKLKSSELFGFPAIFDDGEPKTFSIFTTKPNTVVAQAHHRMPAILAPKDEDVWLDPIHTNLEKMIALLQPYPSELMEGYAVTPAVNSPKNNAPELIQPLKGLSR